MDLTKRVAAMPGRDEGPASGFKGTDAAIRVFLADDHPLLRQGLGTLIGAQPGMAVVGAAADGATVLDDLRQLRPDVVVMDVSMPEIGGAELTARIRVEFPEMKVLAFTAHEDPRHLRSMLEAGALGYVLKSAAAEDLVRAIQTVASGSLYLDKAMSRYAVRALPRVGRDKAAAQLSEREVEVLQAIAQGHAIKDIAARLRVGPRTVETYKARAMQKLELSDRADVIRYALQCGWLRGD